MEEEQEGRERVLELLFLDGVTAEGECLTASADLDPFQEKYPNRLIFCVYTHPIMPHFLGSLLCYEDCYVIRSDMCLNLQRFRVDDFLLEVEGARGPGSGVSDLLRARRFGPGREVRGRFSGGQRKVSFGSGSVPAALRF